MRGLLGSCWHGEASAKEESRPDLLRPGPFPWAPRSPSLTTLLCYRPAARPTPPAAFPSKSVSLSECFRSLLFSAFELVPAFLYYEDVGL